MTSASCGALALVGPGRAGTAITVALARAGWRVVGVAGRDDCGSDATSRAAERFACEVRSIDDVARGADLVIVAVPDAAIATVAARLAASTAVQAGALVIHLAGSLGIDALRVIEDARPDVRVGALHPLQTLPNGDDGAARLAGSWCAVAGDAAVNDLALTIGCHPFVVDDADRARYHAAACIAGNHVVAIIGQVARIADDVGVPLAAFAPLLHAAVDNAVGLGPARALTGPVARNDVATVARHLDAIPEREHDLYRALARAARDLTDRETSELDALL